jgi:predicted Zn finger-like uncharacterized protein
VQQWPPPVDYRCPTCRTPYRIAETGGRAALYVKCKMCGFLIEAVANRTRDARPESVTVPRPERRSVLLPMLAALLLLFGITWALVMAVRWADPVSHPTAVE